MLPGALSPEILSGVPVWMAMAASLPGAVMTFALLFARLGGVLLLLPAFSDDAVPGRVRLLVALGLSAGLMPLLSPLAAPALDALPPGEVAFAGLLLGEMLIGVALGMIVRLMFHAVVIAGGIISLQVGLTSAIVFDPSAGGQVPVLGKFISITALLICMGAGVHHLWIGAMVRSYESFPVGTLPPAADFAQLALLTAQGAMALGLSLAAPLIVYGIVFNAALGLSARLAPALQIFFIAQPLNLLLGIALTAAALAASLSGFADRMADWARQIG